MIPKDDNLPFGNNINEHDESATRILFTNTNGLNVDTDAHSFSEILINSKLKKINVLLLA